MIQVGIIGGAGYTGGELIRLLLRHPKTEINFVQSNSNAGNPITKIHMDLEGETDITFSAEHHHDIDVLFLCAGHGEAKKFLEQYEIPASVRIIDLSHDFRLSESATLKKRKFIYGLPELNREWYRGNTSVDIANPGCFATAIQLGLLPLAKANDYYASHPFTHVVKDGVHLKQVINTNKCLIQPEKVGSKLVIHSVIDNLLKGASGQAVQNMNLIYGLDESMGLDLKASFF